MSDEWKKGYQEGYRDGYKDGEKSKKPPDQYPNFPDIRPPYTPPPYYYNNWYRCTVCGINLSTATHYCCINANCPSKVRWTV